MILNHRYNIILPIVLARRSGGKGLRTETEWQRSLYKHSAKKRKTEDPEKSEEPKKKDPRRLSSLQSSVYKSSSSGVNKWPAPAPFRRRKKRVQKCSSRRVDRYRSSGWSGYNTYCITNSAGQLVSLSLKVRDESRLGQSSGHNTLPTFRGLYQNDKAPNSVFVQSPSESKHTCQYRKFSCGFLPPQKPPIKTRWQCHCDSRLLKVSYSAGKSKGSS